MRRRLGDLLGAGPWAYPEAVEQLYAYLYESENWWIYPFLCLPNVGKVRILAALSEELALVTPIRDRVILFHLFGIADGQPKLPSQIAALMGVGKVFGFGHASWRFIIVRRLFDRYLAAEREANPEPTSESPIERLELSVRAFNLLRKVKCLSIGDVMNYSRERILEIRGMGPKLADEIETALATGGRQLARH